MLHLRRKCHVGINTHFIFLIESLMALLFRHWQQRFKTSAMSQIRTQFCHSENKIEGSGIDILQNHLIYSLLGRVSAILLPGIHFFKAKSQPFSIESPLYTHSRQGRCINSPSVTACQRLCQEST